MRLGLAATAAAPRFKQCMDAAIAMHLLHAFFQNLLLLHSAVPPRVVWRAAKKQPFCQEAANSRLLHLTRRCEYAAYSLPTPDANHKHWFNASVFGFGPQCLLQCLSFEAVTAGYTMRLHIPGFFNPTSSLCMSPSNSYICWFNTCHWFAMHYFIRQSIEIFTICWIGSPFEVGRNAASRPQCAADWLLQNAARPTPDANHSNRGLASSTCNALASSTCNAIHTTTRHARISFPASKTMRLLPPISLHSTAKRAANTPADGEDLSEILQIQHLKDCCKEHKCTRDALGSYCETYQRFTDKSGVFPLGRIKDLIPPEVQTELEFCVNRKLNDHKAKQRLHACIQPPDRRNRKAEACWWQLDFLDLIGWFGGDLSCLSRNFCGNLREAERSGCKRDTFFRTLLEVLTEKEGVVSCPFAARSWEPADLKTALERCGPENCEEEGSTLTEANEGATSKAEPTVEGDDDGYDSNYASDDNLNASAPGLKEKRKTNARREALSVIEEEEDEEAEDEAEDEKEDNEEEDNGEDCDASENGSTELPVEQARGASASPLRDDTWYGAHDEADGASFGDDDEGTEHGFSGLNDSYGAIYDYDDKSDHRRLEGHLKDPQPRTPPRQVSRSLTAGKGTKRTFVDFSSSSPAKVPVKRSKTAATADSAPLNLLLPADKSPIPAALRKATIKASPPPPSASTSQRQPVVPASPHTPPASTSQRRAIVAISSSPLRALPSPERDQPHHGLQVSTAENTTMAQGGGGASSSGARPPPAPQHPQHPQPPAPTPAPAPPTANFRCAPKPADSVPTALDTLQAGRLVTSAALDLVLQVFMPTAFHVADASAAQQSNTAHYRPLQYQAADQLPPIVLPIYTPDHWVIALIDPSHRTCCMLDSWTTNLFHERTETLAMNFCNRLPGGSNGYTIRRPNDFPKQRDNVSCAIMAMLDVLLRTTNLSVPPNARLLDQDTIRYLFRVAIHAAYPEAGLPTQHDLPALAPPDETQVQACQQYLENLRARQATAQLLELVAQCNLSSSDPSPNLAHQEQALESFQSLIALGQQDAHIRARLPPDLAAYQCRIRNEMTLQRMRFQAMDQVVLQARRIRAESMPELSRMIGLVGF
ncbi:uncharacterized protein MYCFIDRAFT_180157 [Pseudocercospora fijiensis CIRAD86]|uniref:Ubiquitin-like protease family profile domain-containing protein n=1 Tax=Pseudocercospora fijiensis (strain CIRAD86) TaxID=383855 RepID=M2YH51_PSEFD|nr:uncharacterized protein MYCFIDRAFT_180157 [Pseudocercospora fijiensis CIRAD86]EME77150.1 hypothetical protein MYCFIDRAFT_180157 [Pseudocercospora fijiensis CIRAD86]